MGSTCIAHGHAAAVSWCCMDNGRMMRPCSSPVHSVSALTDPKLLTIALCLPGAEENCACVGHPRPDYRWLVIGPAKTGVGCVSLPAAGQPALLQPMFLPSPSTHRILTNPDLCSPIKLRRVDKATIVQSGPFARHPDNILGALA